MGLFTANTFSDNTGNETFFFHTSNSALIIFTRNPELGKVKTRLAADVGDEAALNIYKFLIRHSIDITKEIRVDKYVYYSDSIGLHDLWDETIYRKRLQSGTDLGIRMQLAFHDLFTEGYEHVIIMGTDMYDLSKDEIETAFNALQTNDIVIGPAADGGYYLLGMNTLKTEIFINKKWGEASVLDQTLKDLTSMKVKLLSEKNDVDYFEDIKDVEAFQPYLKSIKK